MNKVNLLGRLTKDPAEYQGKNNAIVKLTLAVDRKQQKDKDKSTDFINCVAFGKTAEAIIKYVKKGTQLAITGRINTGSYEKDGKKIYTTDILIEEFYFTGTKQKRDASFVDDDDLPF